MLDVPTPSALAEETVAPPTDHDMATVFRPLRDANELVQTNDAAVWAATFAKILREKGYENDDWEGWLVGWFANAMAAERMWLQRQGRMVGSQIELPEADFDRLYDDSKDVASVLARLVGAASMCWEYPEFQGAFQSERAEAALEAALRRLHEVADVRAYTGETANSAGGA